MRVLFIHERATTGGLETRLLLHAQALMARGHRVYAAREPGLASSLWRAGGCVEVPTEHDPSRAGFGEQVRALRALMRRERIAFCDVHPFWSMLPGCLAALAEGVPLGLNFHGSADWDNDRLLFESSLRWFGERAALLTANSPETRDFVCRRYGIAPERLLCVRNAVDTPTFAALPPPQRPLRRLLILSRLDSDKLLSIRAGLRFADAWAEHLPGAVLRIAGGGDAEESVRRESAALPSVAAGRLSVQWLGRVSEPATAIGDADLVLGLGRVALEGMAARRPVVLCGAAGNLAGLCTLEAVGPWFEQNLSGRGAGEVDVSDVVRQVAQITEEQCARLAEWTRLHAGPAALEPWCEAVEAAAGSATPSAEAEVATQWLEGYFQAIQGREAAREALGRAEAQAAAQSALLGRLAEFVETTACALRLAPTRPWRRFRAIVTLRRSIAPMRAQLEALAQGATKGLRRPEGP